MDVAPDALGLVAHDQRDLGVRLEAEQPVHDVRADALQVARPVDVVLFVEARLELDERRDLFAVLGGVDQRADDRRVARRAVERLLDREDVGIFGGLVHELHDRIERLVRMVQQQIAFADHREDVGLPDQTFRDRRGERRIVQLRLVDADQRPEGRRRHHAVDVVDVEIASSSSASSTIAPQRPAACRLHFEAHRLAEAPFAQFRLDRAQQIVGFVFLQVEVGVARDAEEVRRGHVQPGNRASRLCAMMSSIVTYQLAARRPRPGRSAAASSAAP